MIITFLSLEAKEPLAYGVMSLAGVLRNLGHTVRVVQGRCIKRLITLPSVQATDVFAMSATTGLHRIYLAWAHALRDAFPDKAIVLGGPHPTFFPQVIEQAPFDGVCIGEGEESFPEFIDLWRDGFPQIPDGFWIRHDHGRGPIGRGRPRPPVYNLDALPHPAFDLYYDANRHYRKLPIRVFLPTRGCPYRCTYCFNNSINRLNRQFGPVLRVHDPELAVDQIMKVRKRYGARLVWFLDANFALNQPWLASFCNIYKRRVSLPFFCKLRPERATDKIVRLLVDAGCAGVGIGIESGCERLRYQVLGRRVSDMDILTGCRRLKANGIRILSFNLLGIPTETLNDALRTVAMNVACRVDYAGATILQPYPGTDIASWSVANGYFDGNFDRLSYSYFDPSPFYYFSQRERDRITNLQRLFSFAVEFPEIRTRLRWLIDRPRVRFFEHLFQARHNRAMRRTFYCGFDRLGYVHAGTEDQFEQACRDLSLGVSSL